MSGTANSSAFLRVVRLTALGAGACFGSVTVNAANDAVGDTAAAPGLEEIVVTAQRRSENLENTPVAVSVLSGDNLAKQGIVQESDLQSAVPGLVIRETSNSNELNYVIRGQTVDAYTSSSPAVAAYVNEVQLPNASSNVFFDLASVQVLKGPQGTLFGRNSTGGAVLYTTAKPTNDFGGNIMVEGGNYADKHVEGALNVPLVSDVLLARIAAYYQKRDGFQTNLYDSSRVGDVDRYGTRLSLTLKLGDTFQDTLVIGYNHAGGSSVNPVAYSANFGQGLVPATVLYSPALDIAYKFPGAWAAYLAAHPKVNPNGITAFTAAQNAMGPYTVDLDADLYHHAEDISASNVSTLYINSTTQLKNILGVYRAKTHDSSDNDGSPYDIEQVGTYLGRRYKYRDVSDELQLVGKALDERLSYVTGLYYFDQSRMLNAQTQFFDLEPLAPASPANFDALTSEKSYAGYAQGTYDLSQATGLSGLGLTAGVRYTDEKVKVAQLPGSSVYGLPAPYQNVLSEKTTKPSYQGGLQDQLNSDLLVYIVSRHSFRSGGFNEVAAPLNALATVGGAGFEPEVATDVEVGVKFQGEVAGLPTRANLAVYNEWVTNVQRSVYGFVGGSPAGFTTNVPKAQITGAEFDSQVSPTRWLKAGLNFAFTDARFTEATTELFGTSTTYGPYADAPRWSGSVFAEGSMPLGDNLSGSLRGDVYSQSLVYFGNLNATTGPGTQLPSYTLTGFHLRVEQLHGGWYASVNVKNAFNRVYYVGGMAIGSILGINSAIPGDPRTYTLQIGYSF